MVSWSGHIIPFIVTVIIWFMATGIIAWADNRGRATFRRSVMIGGFAGILGLVAILLSAFSVSVAAVYTAFIGALMVWGWHEIGFLTGAAAGPRRLVRIAQGLVDPGDQYPVLRAGRLQGAAFVGQGQGEVAASRPERGLQQGPANDVTLAKLPPSRWVR